AAIGVFRAAPFDRGVSARVAAPARIRRAGILIVAVGIGLAATGGLLDVAETLLRVTGRSRARIVVGAIGVRDAAECAHFVRATMRPWIAGVRGAQGLVVAVRVGAAAPR